ncbi:MAG: phage terminase large subunit [Planctomycetaceae bacterium]|nr:phage terminase large subunit [Planctomycetaceae bacterium]
MTPDTIQFETDQSGVYLREFLIKCMEKHRRLRYDTKQNVETGMLKWTLHYLGEHCTKAPSKMHRWLCERLDRINTERGTKLNVLAPRGAAKSTIGTFAYPLREALEQREPYIWILSDTMSQAHAHLENIKAELIDNRKLRERYPQGTGKGPTWRGGSIVLNNGVTIEAFGTGQKLRGRRRKQHRPSLIVCDDLQNDQHIVSGSAREKTRSWFHGTLLKAGHSETNVLNLATALHNEAIAMELFTKPGWDCVKFQAILTWPNNRTLWEEWETIYTNLEDPESRTKAEAFYRDHYDAMNEASDVLWPEHEDIYALMKMRVESGRTAFEREKQNSPVNPEFCEWPETYFDETVWFDEMPKPHAVEYRVMALDPSKGSDSSRGDYSAFVVVTLDRSGIYHIDADLARRNVSEIVATGVELYEKYNPDEFVIETNQFQDLLYGDFVDEFKRRRIADYRMTPLENRTNKLVRIRRLGTYLSGRRLRFRNQSPSAKLLVEQMKMFPVGDHDDGPDALEMALRVIGERTRRTLTPSDTISHMKLSH